ncbi:MAG: hypothetical protein KBT02_07665 [Treponema sp.]|nr:hypothetical protein [Candidatus Treponema caballi]
MKKGLSFIAAVLILGTSVFTSCSTTIHTTIERPAELDLNGAETIAVLPFQITEKGNLAQNVTIIGDVITFFNELEYKSNGAYDIADYLTHQLEQGIADSDYLSLVYSDAVKSALNNAKKAPCDVYLTGIISSYNTEIVKTMHTVKENGESLKIPYYYREVGFTLTYQIVDSATNRIITSKTEDVYKNSDEIEDPEELPDAYQTIKPTLNEIVYNIMKKIQPYTETKSISLLKDKTKDPDMKAADKYVKNGLLDYARKLYLDIYETRGYFEAGYNAAVILEAQGNFKEAYEEMNDLVQKYHDSRAISALKDIQYEIDSKNTLQKQLDR